MEWFHIFNLSDVIFLIPGDGGDVEPLRVVDIGLAGAIYDIVGGAVVVAVEHAHIQKILLEEGLLLHLADGIPVRFID